MNETIEGLLWILIGIDAGFCLMREFVWQVSNSTSAPKAPNQSAKCRCPCHGTPTRSKQHRYSDIKIRNPIKRSSKSQKKQVLEGKIPSEKRKTFSLNPNNTSRRSRTSASKNATEVERHPGPSQKLATPVYIQRIPRNRETGNLEGLASLIKYNSECIKCSVRVASSIPAFVLCEDFT